MSYLARRYFPIVTVFLCLLVMDGCGDDSDINLDEGWKWPTTEKVIGQEGGTVEVTDPTSTLYGVKVEIPAGALAQETNIVIEDRWFASFLPAGLTSSSPIADFSPDTMFLKDIQITFPIQTIPSGDDGKILAAFYWDSAKGEWVVVPPQKVNDSKMTIKTGKFGAFRWGIVSLTEVEPETVTAWMEDMFGNWAELQAAVIDRLVEPWISVIENPQSFDSCAVQNSIISQLSIMRDVARQGVADYLATKNFMDKCFYCVESGICTDCNVDKLISGQPVLWLQKEWEGWIWGFIAQWGAGPIADLLCLPGVPELAGIYVAEGYYVQAMEELGCDWRCMLENGNLQFYFDLLVGNASSYSIFAIEFYRSVNGCTP